MRKRKGSHCGSGSSWCYCDARWSGTLVLKHTKKIETINVSNFMSQLPSTFAAEEPVPRNGTLHIIYMLLETFSNAHNELLIGEKEMKLPK